VNRAVTSMDEATQQNATLVEQAATAAQTLRDQAEGLAQTVAVFTVAPRIVIDMPGAASPSGIVTAPPGKEVLA